MNKKFFTLLVAFLATISFGASALTSEGVTGNKYLTSKTYLLGNGHTAGATAGDFIYVESTTGQPLLKLGSAANVLGANAPTLATLRSYLWKVIATPASGSTTTPLYTFQNVATGVVLTMDMNNAVRYDEDENGKQWAGENYKSGVSNLLGGDIAEWIPSTLSIAPGATYFYVTAGTDKIIVLAKEGNDVIARKHDITNANLNATITTNGLQLTPFTVTGTYSLSVNDLNTQLGTRGVANALTGEVNATLENFFNLGIDPENTLESPVTHTLQAQAVTRMEVAFGKDGNSTNDLFFMQRNAGDPFESQNNLWVEVLGKAANDAYYTTGDGVDQQGTADFISMYVKGTKYVIKDGKGSFSKEEKKDDVLTITNAVNDKLDTWYTLYSKEADKYLVVDTVPIPGTEQMNNTLYQYTVDKLYNAKNETRYRHPDSYLFRVEYNPDDNSIKLISKAYVTAASLKKDDKEWVKETTDNRNFYSGDYTTDNPVATTTDGFSKGAVKAGSYYANDEYTPEDGADIDPATADRVQFDGGTPDELDRVTLTHAKLVNEIVYTLGSKPNDDFFLTLGVNPEYITKRITSGLYLLKVTGSKNANAIGKYWKYSLGGKAEYVDLEKRQNFHHIPSAQWVIETSGSSNYPSVKITNREFGSYNFVDERYEGEGFGRGITYQVKDEAGNLIKDQFFFFGGDTIEFEAVKDKSGKLGYKNIEFPDGFDPTVYVFKYLHELAMDKPVNTVNDKDSALWVDTDDNKKVSFRIEKVLGEKFGYTGANTPQLERNVYRIKVYQATNFEVIDSYITYNQTSKKFYLTSNKNRATNFFLKENNEVPETGICYYTFLEANLEKGFAKAKLNDDGEWVADNERNKDASGNVVSHDASKFGDKWMYVEGFEDKTVTITNENGTGTYHPFVPKEYNFGTTTDRIVYRSSVADPNQVYMNTGREDGSNEDIYYRIYPSGSLDKDGNYAYDNATYANGKVSVDNNSLSLVFGVLDDSFGTQVANSAFSVGTDGTRIYRLLGTKDGEEDDVNIVKFYRVRNTAAREYLYEDANSEYSKDLGLNFLGIEGKGMTENAPMIVRNMTGDIPMPQYLISVDEEVVPAEENICPFCQGKDPNCEHSTFVREHIKGRFLINLKDSIDYYDGNASAMKKFTFDNGYTRLAFVDGKLYDDSTLVISNSAYTGNENPIDWNDRDITWASKDTIDLSTKKYSPVLYSFRLLNDEPELDFFIESESWKDDGPWNGAIQPTKTGGWIKIQNGVPVIVNAPQTEDFKGADIFNIDLAEEGELPTSNEGIEAGDVKVIAGTGTVTIKGAAGKQVVVANVLGQVVSNQVLTSDEATIAAPAGVVVVSVDGTATKALVK